MVCIPHTTINVLDIYVAGGNETFRAMISKLGVYLPQPTSARVKLQLTSWSANPYQVVADGMKVRPGDLLTSLGVEVYNISVEVQDLDNCNQPFTMNDGKLYTEECMQLTTILFNVNTLCDITGHYWVDYNLRVDDGGRGDITRSVQVELGMDSVCDPNYAVGVIPLNGRIEMFADQALTIQKSTFTSYEHVHILVEAESIKTIASVDIRRITLHQTNRPDGGDIIYELGIPVGWGEDPDFNLQIDDWVLDTQQKFSFALLPQYIPPGLSGNELIVCVDIEVTYSEGSRSRRSLQFKANNQPLSIEAPVYIFTSNEERDPEVSNFVENSPSKDSNVMIWVLLVLIVILSLCGCGILGFGYFTYIRKTAPLPPPRKAKLDLASQVAI